jgi:DNA-binding NarL/FixJ family response regulator
VLVADDHPAMRSGLVGYLSTQSDMEIAGEAGDGVEAVERFRALRPDAVLIDIQMPRMDGLDAIAAIRAADAEAAIVVLTTYPGDARVMRALTLGATAYLLKSADLQDIADTIRAAMAGKHRVAEEVARQLAKFAGHEHLTARELSVLRLVAKGEGNRSIAAALGISEDTVKSRLRSIMGKLHAQDRTHAVVIAVQRGFLDP